MAAPAWAPSPDDVARVAYEFTREAWTTDREYAGMEAGRFTDATTPCLDHVQALIEGACREVVGRVGTTEIRPRDQDLARQAVVWHVAADIAAIVLPNGTEDATGMYQVHSRNYAFALADLISQARMPTALDVL